MSTSNGMAKPKTRRDKAKRKHRYANWKQSFKERWKTNRDIDLGQIENGPFRVMRPHTEAERAALKESIRHDGCITVPVYLDGLGSIIDGHLRIELWHELREQGVKLPNYPRKVIKNLTVEEKRALARNLNIARRHLSRGERNQLIDDQLKETPEQSDSQIARSLGVSDKTVTSRRHRLEATSEIPKLERTVGADGKSRPSRRTTIHVKDDKEEERLCDALLDLGSATLPDKEFDVRKLERLARKKRWADNKDKVPDPNFSMANIDLRVGDCEEALKDVADGSVKLFLTDPPYDEEGVYDILAYQKLARLTARLLHRKGLLLTYTGNMFLPQIIADLSVKLSYYWQMALVHKGQCGLVPNRPFIGKWKPILLWHRQGVKIKVNSERSIPDIIVKTEPPDKRLHPWQQGVPEAVWLLEQFTKPGDLVCDPFLGSGTVVLACLKTGRRFVGCDIEPGYVAIAQEELMKLKAEMEGGKAA